MSNRPLDHTADTLPVGLQGTPFEAVYDALSVVASAVWDIDPATYRAGIAWGWYLTHRPEELESFRELLAAALISEQAPLVKDTQTDSELVEYLRIWRSYTPTYAKLQAIYSTFGVQTDIQPISDAESQQIMPVADRRLAFYIRVESMDWSRPLTLTEIANIAIRATPLGSRPYPYFALFGEEEAYVSAGGSGYNRVLRAVAPAVEPDDPPLPTLPTISLSGDFGANNWVDLSYIHPGQTREVTLDSLAIPYDSTKSYAVAGVTYTGSSVPVAELIDLSVAETNDHTFGLKNLRIEDVRITTARIAVCSDPSATVVHVYDKATGLAYNAFKYTDDGVDYYYILDGVQSAWSNDIDALGFALGDGFTESMLYLQSGDKQAQKQVTSGFTGNVNATYCYQLYEDEQLTTPWTRYDYSNEYVFVNSRGIPLSRQKVSDLPDTYTSDSTQWEMALILMDNGFLWLASNVSGSGSISYSAGFIRVRIYPKGQQVFSGYFNSSNVYNNSSLSYNSAYNFYGSPNTGTTRIPLISDFDRSLVKFLGSAGNVVSNRYNNFAWLSGQYLRVTYGNTNDGTLAIRNVLYTFGMKVYTAWVNKTGNSSVSSGTAVYTYNNISNGYLLGYETGVGYKVIALFKSDGSSAAESSTVINACSLGKYGSGSYANNLFFKQTSGSSISFSYLWYTKEYLTPIDIFFTLRADGVGATFSAKDYWGTWIMSDADIATLQNFGITIGNDGSNKNYVTIGNTSSFTFEPLALYNGSTDLGADMSNFSCGAAGSTGVYTQMVCIKSVNAYSTQATKWKCRITRIL